MRADMGDHQPHHRAGRRADQKGGRDTQHEGTRPGLGAAELQEHPGQGQPGDVGGVDDRKVQPARDDRHQHRQRQEAKLG